jgi:hypothetical protein
MTSESFGLVSPGFDCECEVDPIAFGTDVAESKETKESSGRGRGTGRREGSTVEVEEAGRGEVDETVSGVEEMGTFSGSRDCHTARRHRLSSTD